MRIVSKSIAISPRNELLENIAPLSDFLFLDIETTGLNAAEHEIYLIGCIYWQSDGWNLIQWMDTAGNEEREVLSSFLLFASRFKYLIHYNGDRFDLPFLRKRLESHSLTDTTHEAQSIDLYKVILPCRRLLGLSDYKQQTMEMLLGSGRTEAESGGDLVKVYKKYIVDPDKALLEKLLEHNEADVTGLLFLLHPAVCVSLGNKSRDCHREPRCRKRKEDIVDIVGAHKHGIAFVAQNVAERYFIYRAEYLHYDDAESEYQSAVYVSLSLSVISHLRSCVPHVPRWRWRGSKSGSLRFRRR